MSKQAYFRFTKQQRLVCVGAVFVGCGIYLGVQLDMMGAAGEHHAQIWDFIIALFGIAASITTAVIQLRRPVRHSVESTDEHRPKQPIMTPVVVLSSLALALIAFAIPAYISRFSFAHWQQEQVTSQVTVTGSDNMQDGSVAYITLPETKHRELALTLKVSSLITSGSCVSPAQLVITPTHNGNDEAPLTAIHSGETKRISVRPQTTTQLFVRVDLSEEPSCRVKLHVADAVFAR